MPNWTTNELVKTHLLNPFQGSLHFENQEVVLTDTDETSLAHRLITDNSETVKLILLSTLSKESVTLTDEDWESLAQDDIAPDTVLLATHELLSTVYVEGDDYIVDYELGKIRRSNTTSIANPATLTIWYKYFHAYIKTTHYTIDYDAGTLARVGATIPNGATVLIDYDVSAADIAETLVTNAVLQAEDKILYLLSDDYGAASGDQGLITGATELALSIVMQALSIYLLQHSTIEGPHSRATEFRNLSWKLEKQAFETLSPFLDPTIRRSPTTKTNP